MKFLCSRSLLCAFLVAGPALAFVGPTGCSDEECTCSAERPIVGTDCAENCSCDYTFDCGNGITSPESFFCDEEGSWARNNELTDCGVVSATSAGSTGSTGATTSTASSTGAGGGG